MKDGVDVTQTGMSEPSAAAIPHSAALSLPLFHSASAPAAPPPHRPSRADAGGHW